MTIKKTGHYFSSDLEPARMTLVQIKDTSLGSWQSVCEGKPGTIAQSDERANIHTVEPADRWAD